MNHDRNVGINSEIVRILKEYNKKIPKDFLARKLGRNISEIEKPLKNLKEYSIIEIQGNQISI